VTRSRYRNFDPADRADEYDEYDEYDEPQRNRARLLIMAIVPMVAGALVAAGIYFYLTSVYRPPAPPADPNPPSPAAAQLAAAARTYETLADASDKQLDVEEDAYADDEHDDLAAAKSELRAQVATERLFDKELAAIKFPATVEATAQALIRANEARFRVTLRQARAKTLAALQALDSARKAGDAAVEVQAELIRKELHLPAVPAS
jgi:hypothetical protein